MRRHERLPQGSTKQRRVKAWTRGLEILKTMVKQRQKSNPAPFARGETSRMFVLAREMARAEYDSKH